VSKTKTETVIIAAVTRKAANFREGQWQMMELLISTKTFPLFFHIFRTKQSVW